jgi:hypothetical protein
MVPVLERILLSDAQNHQGREGKEMTSKLSRRTFMAGASALSTLVVLRPTGATKGPAAAPRYEVIDIGENDAFAANVGIDDRSIVTGHVWDGQSQLPALWSSSTGVALLESHGSHHSTLFGNADLESPDPHHGALDIVDQRVMMAGNDILVVSVLEDDDPFAISRYQVSTLRYRRGSIEPVASLTGNAPMIPFAANDAMQIVGVLNVEEEVAGALWIDGQTWRLSDLLVDNSGFTVTQPVDINNHGEILAFALDTHAIEHSVILQPVA